MSILILDVIEYDVMTLQLNEYQLALNSEHQFTLNYTAIDSITIVWIRLQP